MATIETQDDGDIIFCPTCNVLVEGLLMAVNEGGVCLSGVPCGHFYPLPPDFHVFLEAIPPEKEHFLEHFLMPGKPS